MAKFVISMDWDSKAMANFNGNSMIQGVASNRDFALGCGQCLLQV